MKASILWFGPCRADDIPTRLCYTLLADNWLIAEKTQWSQDSGSSGHITLLCCLSPCWCSNWIHTGFKCIYKDPCLVFQGCGFGYRYTRLPHLLKTKPEDANLPSLQSRFTQLWMCKPVLSSVQGVGRVTINLGANSNKTSQVVLFECHVGLWGLGVFLLLCFVPVFYVCVNMCVGFIGLQQKS